jgi:hypothetical protein
MMFKFYQPQEKEQRMIKTQLVVQVGDDFYDVRRHDRDFYLTLTTQGAFDLMVEIAQALRVATPIKSTSPAASTPPDPALLLAQRIASIAAETGLKPRIVFNIVNHAYWEEKEALEATSPQENHTDDTAAQLLRIAQELGPHDNAALVTIASRILSKEIY